MFDAVREGLLRILEQDSRPVERAKVRPITEMRPLRIHKELEQMCA